MIRTLALATVAAALAACQPEPAYRIGQLEVGETSSRPAAEGMNGAGYLTVTNRSRAPDRLQAVESPFAERVEIHESSTAGGVMRMRQLETGYVIQPGERLELKPGAGHLMLIGLKRPLKAGETFPATLVFEEAGRLPVEFTVQAGASQHGGH